MTANLLNGNVVAEKIQAKLVKLAKNLTQKGCQPGLAAILVGNDPASHTYVSIKVKTCEALGIRSEKIILQNEVNTSEIVSIIQDLNQRTNVHGILVQMPLPKHVDSKIILNSISPEKDIDGFHPINLGKLASKQNGFIPCTPAGIIEIIDHYKIPLQGRNVVVLGRSTIVGLPLSLLLLHRNATVTICHSHTQFPEKIASTADILIAAIGRPGYVTKEFIKPGATVIDVGINRIFTKTEVLHFFGNEKKKQEELAKKGYVLIGDVHPLEALGIAGNFTPVPGGVGPTTIAMLMRNTVDSAQNFLENLKISK